MAGFRLDDAAAEGCPPTQQPPSNYEMPFREDDAGALWLRGCFKSFWYYGAARHDISYGIRWIGSTNVPVETGVAPLNLRGLNEGKYKNVTVKNTTEKRIGIMLGLEVIGDILCRSDNMINLIIMSRWNGILHSAVGASTANYGTTGTQIRQIVTCSAIPHDIGFEGADTSSTSSTDPDSTLHTMYLEPGETGVVGAKLAIQYTKGIPDGQEVLVFAESAVRVYGFTI